MTLFVFWVFLRFLWILALLSGLLIAMTSRVRSPKWFGINVSDLIIPALVLFFWVMSHTVESESTLGIVVEHCFICCAMALYGVVLITAFDVWEHKYEVF